MIGFIYLHRQIMDWEWYSDSKMVHLFLHLVLLANHTDKKWQGVTIKKGQLITSLQGLSNSTGISVQTVRTLLAKLQKTGEIKVEPTRFFTIITISKYRSYQEKDEPNQHTTNIRLTHDQHTANTRPTTTKNDKNYKNDKEVIYTVVPPVFDFKASLLDYGFEKPLVEDWLKVRKSKRATNTETALKNFISQVEKCGKDKNEILRTCIEKDWRGFEAEWMINVTNQLNGRTAPYAIIQNQKQQQQDELRQLTASLRQANPNI